MESVDSYEQGIESTLQLFSYHLETGEEEEHTEFFLDEFNDWVEDLNTNSKTPDAKQANLAELSHDDKMMDLLTALKNNAPP